MRPDPPDHPLPAGQQRVHERPGVRPGDRHVPASAEARQHTVHRQRSERLHDAGLRGGPVRPDAPDHGLRAGQQRVHPRPGVQPDDGSVHAPTGPRQHALHRYRQQRVHGGGLRGGPVRAVAHPGLRDAGPLPVLRDQAEGVRDRPRRLGGGSVRPAHRDRPLRAPPLRAGEQERRGSHRAHSPRSPAGPHRVGPQREGGEPDRDEPVRRPSSWTP